MSTTQRIGLVFLLSAIVCLLILILYNLTIIGGSPPSSGTVTFISGLWVFGCLAFIWKGWSK